MCGIIGIINPIYEGESVHEEVAERFEAQRGRGTEGFGIVEVDNKNIIKIHRSIGEYKALLDLYTNPRKIIFMHHRQPTSTDNEKKQTHPIYVNNINFKHKYYVMHNGIILNNDDVKDEHERLGYKYNTLKEEQNHSSIKEKFNDSECIAIELARHIENKNNTIIAAGSAAFIVLQVNKETNELINTFFGTNSSKRLKFSQNRNKIRIASEGGGNDVEENILYKIDMETYKITKSPIYIPTTETKLEKLESPKEKKKENEELGDEEIKYSKDEGLNKLLEAARTDIVMIIDDFLKDAGNPTYLFGESFSNRVEETYDEVYQKLDLVMTDSINELQNYDTGNKDIKEKQEEMNKPSRSTILLKEYQKKHGEKVDLPHNKKVSNIPFEDL